MSPSAAPRDPVLLITGASTGIGAASARAAAEAGYRLVLAARSEDKLTALADELGGPDRALVTPCDVTEMADNERAVAAALDGFGRLDAVFANAGFGAGRGFLEESPEHWRDMILTNILGVGLTIRASLPHMLSEGRGHYLITSSIAGRRALPGSMYSASKHAVTAMGEALRSELREMHDPNKVRVTLIEPGMVDTPFFDNPLEAGTALDGEDIARAVIFALGQPEHVDVNEILIRPIAQPT